MKVFGSLYLRRGIAVSAIFLFLLLGSFASPAHANQLTNFTTVFGTDFAMFGFGGMRGLGTGTIDVTGISGTVTRAYIYWHGPTNSTDPNSNASVTFNGMPVTGTNIGSSSDNCWGFTNSQAYRADVTSMVTGNGSYSLSSFTKVDADINGVSLLVFYNDGNATNNRDIVIFEGNDSSESNSFDPIGWSASLPGINYNGGTASMRMIVSDGQIFPDIGVSVNSNTIFPDGGLNFQGDSLSNGPSAGTTNGGLWDHKASDITSLLSPGVNNLTLADIDGGSGTDCLSLIDVIFDLPAGAAPGGPPAAAGPVSVPTMTEWGVMIFMVFAGFASLYYLRRQKRA